jgi:hypothetical protein
MNKEFGIKWEERLAIAFASKLERRIPPSVTITNIDGGRAVFLDVTLKAKEGDEKAYQCQSWKDRPWIQHRSANFVVLPNEENDATLLERRFVEALGRLAACGLGEESKIEGVPN